MVLVTAPKKRVLIGDAIKGAIARTALTQFLASLKRDKDFMSFLSGYKTYIIAGLCLVMLVLHMLGIDVPGVSYQSYDIGTLIAVFFARQGAAADANKAAAHLALANNLTAPTPAIANKVVQLRQAS